MSSPLMIELGKKSHKILLRDLNHPRPDGKRAEKSKRSTIDASHQMNDPDYISI